MMSMEKDASSGDFLRDYRVPHRLSVYCVVHLRFTTSTATHTRFRVEVRALHPAVAFCLLCENNIICRFSSNKH